jgi:exodeoxyribonuclease VII small subunit
MPEEKEIKFEDGLAQMEKLVEELEGGELDLDEALKRFEKGVKLSQQLNQSLEAANRRVEKLSVKADGEAEVEDFEASPDATPKKPKAPKKPKGSQDSLF